MIVYSNRSMDLSYINPFNFYKSAEHANQDRDNSLLFLDLQNNSLKGISFYGSISGIRFTMHIQNVNEDMDGILLMTENRKK